MPTLPVAEVLVPGATWINRDGHDVPLTLNDVLVVVRHELQRHGPAAFVARNEVSLGNGPDQAAFHVRACRVLGRRTSGEHEREEGKQEAQHYFFARFEELRKEPDDSLLSILVNREIPEWGRPLNDNELQAEMMADLFVGGSETTTTLWSRERAWSIRSPATSSISRAAFAASGVSGPKRCRS